MQRTPYLLTQDNGTEIWIQFDESAEVFELFTERECESYIGCADTRAEAIKVANWYLNDIATR